jgi:hypothetical protein
MRLLLEENRYAAVAPRRAYLMLRRLLLGESAWTLDARLPSTAAENKMHSRTARDAVTAQYCCTRKKYVHALDPSRFHKITPWSGK